MDERRAGIIASLAVLGIAALVATLLLLRSYEAAIALYIIGFAVALSLIEPFAGLIIYLAYVYITVAGLIVFGSCVIIIIGA